MDKIMWCSSRLRFPQFLFAVTNLRKTDSKLENNKENKMMRLLKFFKKDREASEKGNKLTEDGYLKPDELGDNKTRIVVNDIDGSKYVKTFNSNDKLSAVKQFVKTKREEKNEDKDEQKCSKKSKQVTTKSTKDKRRSLIRAALSCLSCCLCCCKCCIPKEARDALKNFNEEDIFRFLEDPDSEEVIQAEPSKPQICNHGPIGFRMTYPRREFRSSADFKSTLKDLGLVPSGVLHVFVVEKNK